MKKVIKTLCMALVVVFAGLIVTACKPSTVEKAEEKMKEAGYTVVAFEAGKDAEGYVGSFMASKVSIGSGVEFDGMLAILFDNTDDAKEFGETYEAESKYGEVKVDGKWVYAGTEAAIDAFLG